MAELSLKERLQPALLDRLIDDARVITIFTIQCNATQLASLQLSPQALISILSTQGLQLQEQDTASAASLEDVLRWQFVAHTTVSPAQLKSLVVKPPGAPQGIALQDFCTIEWRSTLNVQPEVGEKSMISMRRLRECVRRDLGWLLNSTSLDTTETLSDYPFVTTSVLNYGMPAFAGRGLHALDPAAIANRIREVIEAFEPRLSKVKVVHEAEDAHAHEPVLTFRIEAELWGQPLAQHLVLKTSLDVESGDVRIGE